jgi:hypothetical protein
VIVQGDAVSSLRAVGIDRDLPEGEALVSVPRELLYPKPLDLPGLGAWLTERHKTDLIRVETLSQYGSASDGDDVHRYHAGEAQPESEARTAWLQRLAADRDAGKQWRKIHLVRDGQLSWYEEFEFGWGFTGTTGAGEDVRVLEVDSDSPLLNVGDFFVLEGHHVARSQYDGDCRFVAAHVMQGPEAVAYRALADMLWRDAEPFASWWGRHTSYHRRSRAA